jgi:hypothetical protein
MILCQNCLPNRLQKCLLYNFFIDNYIFMLCRCGIMFIELKITSRVSSDRKK